MSTLVELVNEVEQTPLDKRVLAIWAKMPTVELPQVSPDEWENEAWYQQFVAPYEVDNV